MLRNQFGHTLIEHLDDMCHIESSFGLFGDRVSFGAMILLGKGAQVEAQFARFGDSANLDAR